MLVARQETSPIRQARGFNQTRTAMWQSCAITWLSADQWRCVYRDAEVARLSWRNEFKFPVVDCPTGPRRHGVGGGTEGPDQPWDPQFPRRSQGTFPRIVIRHRSVRRVARSALLARWRVMPLKVDCGNACISISSNSSLVSNNALCSDCCWRTWIIGWYAPICASEWLCVCWLPLIRTADSSQPRAVTNCVFRCPP